ncbi:MAG TPA: phosphotransferase [Rhizomicrobium sp.]|nr:phosphotransferase [Rhizomicrobium sp.]
MNTPAALIAPAEQSQDLQTLGGHSGASLVIFRRDQKTFVRKTAKARDSNVRLRQQAIKQRLLGAQGLGFPAVHEIGTDEAGLAFFEMDYVPARTLADIIAGAAPHDRNAVMEAITRLIGHLVALQTGPLPSPLFHNKIADIVRQSARLEPLLSHRDLIAAIAGRLGTMDWNGIPYSPGHGDLTLENILISPEQGIVFIDCDEPFASSWWLDVAKLFQDIEGRWFLRGDANPSVDALARLAQLGAQLRAYAGLLAPKLPQRITQLAALHLFRTLPYVRDDAVAGYVCASIARILKGYAP